MDNNQEYLDELQLAVSQLYTCDACYCGSIKVHEIFQGKTLWNGIVEIFNLHNHPKARRCYAWMHLDGENDENTRVVTVLEIPPVSSPQTAVKASIMADAKTPQS